MHYMFFIYFPIFYTVSIQENLSFNQIFEDIIIIVTCPLLVCFLLFKYWQFFNYCKQHSWQ